MTFMQKIVGSGWWSKDGEAISLSEITGGGFTDRYGKQISLSEAIGNIYFDLQHQPISIHKMINHIRQKNKIVEEHIASIDDKIEEMEQEIKCIKVLMEQSTT